jgi:dolichyl-phosphate beta-glucosyltransferase
MRLSLIIPAYNEVQRLGGTLEHVVEYFLRCDYTWEVIVVDDGSTDGTAQVVVPFAERYGEKVRCVGYGENRGKGYAVRFGMLQAAVGDYRIFYDADASTPIYEVEKMWPFFEAGADIVIGSRAHPQSQILVHQARYREWMGKVNNAILRLLGITRFRDTQCGFKGFTRRACEVVFSRQTIVHFSFDAELLYIAQKHGLRIEEIPIRWINSPKSKVNPVADAAKMFLDVLTIRWKDLRGMYD